MAQTSESPGEFKNKNTQDSPTDRDSNIVGDEIGLVWDLTLGIFLSSLPILRIIWEAFIYLNADSSLLFEILIQ